MTLAEGAESYLDEVAAKSEGMTGADLQAVPLHYVCCDL